MQEKQICFAQYTTNALYFYTKVLANGVAIQGFNATLTGKLHYQVSYRIQDRWRQI